MANRETQLVLEVIKVGSPSARLTQGGLEFVVGGFPKVRLAQLELEVIVLTVPNPPPQAIMQMMLP